MTEDLKRALIQSLANAQTSRITTLLATIQHADKNSSCLEISGSVYFLRNYTIEPIEPFLKLLLYKQEIKPQLKYSGYGAIQQEILDDSSSLYASKPDVVVLSLMLDQLDPACERADWSASNATEIVEQILSLLAERTTATILVNTFIPPFYPRTGLLIAAGNGDVESEVYGLNQFIRSYVKRHAPRFVLSDWERMLRIIGEQDSIDYRCLYLAKAPFKSRFLEMYAQDIARLTGLLKGKYKKCLILDCDNTLWGDIVGEAGIDGIHLNPDSWPGRGYYEFQTGVLDLIERGILVALCSKNNEPDVFNVLDNHPHSLIKKSHLAAWRINWENKPTNIASLANELKLGLDSFVYVDDDPRECEIVTRALPEVTVLRVPHQISEYPPLLFRTGLFDRLQTTTEDRQRTALYRSEHERVGHREQFQNIDDYLASLDTTVKIHPVTGTECGRVAQLTQRTNQFNLSVHRYTEQDIRTFSNSPAHAVFVLNVRDRFGEIGLTGVFIAENRVDISTIDTFLLSCRVLGKGIENAFLAYCICKLEDTWGLENWQAPYIASTRNQQVASFIEKVGFIKSHVNESQVTYMLPRGQLRNCLTPHILVLEE